MNVIAGIFAAVGAVPGVAALVAFFVGYGSLLNRVKNMEANQAKMEVEIATLRGMAVTVGRIDERTDTTKSQVAAIDRKIDSVIGALLREPIREPRSFAET